MKTLGNLNKNFIGLKNNYDWLLKITDKENLLNHNGEIIEQLKSYDCTIFFNDSTCKYWIFDFKINGIWFEATHIDCIKHVIELNVYK